MIGKTDKYGNYVDFPDTVLSDMTKKGLLGKWTSLLVNQVLCALRYYYFRTGNVDRDDLAAAKMWFGSTKDELDFVVPVLLDMCNREIRNFEDMCAAVYGDTSAEAYMVKRFYQLLGCIDEWDTELMWNDCCNDELLRSFLL